MIEEWRNELITAGDMFDFYMKKWELANKQTSLSPMAAAVHIKEIGEAKLKFRKDLAAVAEKAFPWPGNDT